MTSPVIWRGRKGLRLADNAALLGLWAFAEKLLALHGTGEIRPFEALKVLGLALRHGAWDSGMRPGALGLRSQIRKEIQEKLRKYGTQDVVLI